MRATLQNLWIATLVCTAAALPGCSGTASDAGHTVKSHTGTRPETRARMSLQGAPAVSVASAIAINSTLGNVIHTTLRGDPGGVVNNLSTPDQRRIGAFSDADRASLAQAARNFDTDWSSRYGKAFSWDSSGSQAQIFQRYQISRGQDDKHAYVVIPAGYGMQRVTLLLHDEGNNNWKINAPDSMTQPMLRDRMSRTLNDLNREKEKLPSDSADAARSTAHKILAILANT